MTADILVERDGRTALLTFNRPDARNAMTFEMYDALHDLCGQLDADPDVRVLVLTGAGEPLAARRDGGAGAGARARAHGPTARRGGGQGNRAGRPGAPGDGARAPGPGARDESRGAGSAHAGRDEGGNPPCHRGADAERSRRPDSLVLHEPGFSRRGEGLPRKTQARVAGALTRRTVYRFSLAWLTSCSKDEVRKIRSNWLR